jgi:hypothetical protein
MTNEIAKKQLVLLLKNGLEIWMDETRALYVQKSLLESKAQFFSLEEEGLKMQSIHNIEGLYTPEQLSEIKKSKQGYWRCEFKKLHERGSSCNCIERKPKYFFDNRNSKALTLESKLFEFNTESDFEKFFNRKPTKGETYGIL